MSLVDSKSTYERVGSFMRNARCVERSVYVFFHGFVVMLAFFIMAHSRRCTCSTSIVLDNNKLWQGMKPLMTLRCVFGG